LLPTGQQGKRIKMTFNKRAVPRLDFCLVSNWLRSVWLGFVPLHSLGK
jgi:hypothetical protein